MLGRGSKAGGSAPAVFRQVATATYFPAALSAVSTTSMIRKGHFARDDITALKLGYSTAYTNTTVGGEAPLANDLPIKAWIEYPAGNYVSVLFGGSATPTLLNDTANLSDATAIVIPNGAQFWTWTWAGARAAQTLTYNGSLNASLGEGCIVATSAVPTAPSGSVPGTTNIVAFSPCVILAQTTAKSVVIYGDSRAYGVADTVDANLNRGALMKTLAPSMACANLSTAGDRTGGILAGSSGTGNFNHRLYWSQFFTHVLDEYGTNDFYVSLANNVPAVMGHKDRLRAKFSGKVYVTNTVEPNSTSTDAWATTVNQTATTISGYFTAYNQAIRASGITYLEISTPTSSALDSGIWGAGYTADGLHASPTGIAAQVAAGSGFYGTVAAAPTLTYAWAPIATNLSAVFTTTGQRFGTGFLSAGGLTNFGLHPVGGSFTIEVWAKQTTLRSGTLVGSNGVAITVSAAGVVSGTLPGQTLTGTGASIVDGLWHHLAMVSTPTGAKLYQDGVEVGTVTANRTILNPNARAFGIRGVGAANLASVTNNVNDPALDELAIWAISKYTGAFTPPAAPYVGNETGLVALMHLDDATIIVGPGA